MANHCCAARDAAGSAAAPLFTVLRMKYEILDFGPSHGVIGMW